MILFSNIYITDVHVNGVGSYINREMAKTADKLDVYMYCLASISKIYPWKKVIIKTKLDEKYEARREELNKFIETEFSGYDLIIENDRNETQEECQRDYDLLDDNLIWFTGNHDHAFIDNDYTDFRKFVNAFVNKTGVFSLQYSHFPEFLYEPFFFSKPVKYYDEYFELFGKYHHSLHIISKELYKYYWFEVDLPKDQIWGRVDNFKEGVFHKEFNTFIPYKEFCRHYDGYQHCASPFPNYLVPVLEIPDGFFENNIKINYSPTYKEGYTNLNPKSSSLKIWDSQGTDYWYSKKFIPKFWLPRISEFIDDFSSKEENTLNDNFIMRNLQFIQRVNYPEVKTKIFNAYM